MAQPSIPRSAIVIVVDRLGAGFLGPYGNTWLETPEFNRLASESFLCEHMLADSPLLETVYRSYWRGLHACCPQDVECPRPLAELLAAHGVATTLLTDESAAAEQPLARPFAQHLVLSPPQSTTAALDLEETQLAGLFATAAQWLSEANGQFLLWIHARGMSGPWDAPIEFRRQFADEEDDPPPPEFVAPPSGRLAAGFDPDEAWGLVQAYAGQVSVLDASLGLLLDAITENPAARSALLTLTSPRGFPLGEHLRIGSTDEALYAESLHVPWLLRFPDGTGALQRSQALVQPPDLYATLAEWFGIEADSRTAWGRSLLPLVSGQQSTTRDRACAWHAGERAIRTPAWFLRESGDAHRELFVKPDDRWEVNEVAVRCATVADELSAAVDQFAQAAQNLPFTDPPPLSAVLAEGLD